ncbi:MAG: Flp pilus assembly protein TadB [Flavobacteriales bacterium]|jgi:Flp pilus assembly protein TadB
MKKSLLSLAICLAVAVNFAYASFPVVKAQESNQTEVVATDSQIQAVEDAGDIKLTKEARKEFRKNIKELRKINKKNGGNNEMLISLILLVFLGGVAAHRWYARKPAGWNILFILTLGGFGIWALVDLVNILTDNF